MIAQSDALTYGLPATTFWTIIGASLIIGIIQIAGMWKAFHKAGHPGWAAIIPIYNVYVLCKVAKRPGWWFLLFLIPFVGFVIFIIVTVDVAKHFGKSVGFAIGLLLLGVIFWPILGFGDATYDSSPGA